MLSWWQYHKTRFCFQWLVASDLEKQQQQPAWTFKATCTDNWKTVQVTKTVNFHQRPRKSEEQGSLQTDKLFEANPDLTVFIAAWQERPHRSRWTGRCWSNRAHRQPGQTQCCWFLDCAHQWRTPPPWWCSGPRRERWWGNLTPVGKQPKIQVKEVVLLPTASYWVVI